VGKARRRKVPLQQARRAMGTMAKVVWARRRGGARYAAPIVVHELRQRRARHAAALVNIQCGVVVSSANHGR